MTPVIKIDGYQCNRCNHKWVPRDFSKKPMICPNCKQDQAFRVDVLKCLKCGFSEGLENDTLAPGWKLKITYDSTEQEITILGNAQGLRFLAEACLAVIGKHDPSGHIHLQWQMNNLLEGSTSTRVEFSDTEEDYSSSESEK